jgi:hypothetical protein
MADSRGPPTTERQKGKWSDVEGSRLQDAVRDLGTESWMRIAEVSRSCGQMKSPGCLSVGARVGSRLG